MQSQHGAPKETPLRPHDPLCAYLDLNTEALDPTIKNLCSDIEESSSTQAVTRAMKAYAAVLAEKYELEDWSDGDRHGKLFSQLGQAGAHVLAKFDATDLLDDDLARSIVERAEIVRAEETGSDRPPELYELQRHVREGFAKGSGQPFLKHIKNLSERLEEMAADAKRAQEEREARLERIGAPCNPADFDFAERLLALVPDKLTATSPEAVDLCEKIKYGSPRVVVRFLELAKKAHGAKVIDAWLTQAQKDRIAKLETSLAEVKGLPGKFLKLLKACGRFFRNQDKRDFVRAYDGSVLKTFAIDGPEFADWVNGLAMEHLDLALTSSGLADARAAGGGLAAQSGETREVYRRVATTDDATYVDLCDPEWQAIEITAGGWKVVKDPPVWFERSREMHELPHPVRGGSTFDLERFINVGNEMDLVNCVAWLVMAQRNDKACPLLAFIGPSGTAKSTSQTTLRRLVDPNKGDLRVAPKTTGDVVVAASNNWVVSYENISKLPGNVQDVFCSVVTGGAFSTRELYTTNAEHVAQFQRPIIINGITNFITRPDLMQRTINIEPPEIDSSSRRTDDQVRSEFNAMGPKLLGAVLDIHAKAMALLPEVETDVRDKGWGLPRMASFALTGEAVAQAMGLQPGSWFANYNERIAEQANDVLDSSLVFAPLLTFMRKQREWTGTNDKLRTALEPFAGTSADWFKFAKGFANALRRIEGEIKAHGINIYRSRSNGISKLTITYETKLDKSRGVTTVRDPDGYSEGSKFAYLSDVRRSARKRKSPKSLKSKSIK
jgi:hypothetical protein